VLTPIGGGPINLDLGAWKKIVINSQVVPSIAGKTLGSCGNDALYFQIAMPLSAAIQVDFILPSMYLGAVTSNLDFHTLDEVESVTDTPRTGDIRTSLNAFSPYGWLLMNDGTIGNASSNATALHNVTSFQLFDLLWRTFQSAQNLAPMLTSGGAPIAYGASSVADFTSDRQITLTRSLGRVMAGTLPTQTLLAFTTPTPNTLTVLSTAALIMGAPVTFGGGGLPPGLTAGGIFYLRIPSPTTVTVFPTANDAINNTNQILFAALSGSGTLIFPADSLGTFLGDRVHTLTIAELPAHAHPGSTVPFSNEPNSRGGGAADTVTNAAPGAVTVAAQGGDVPHNITQPTVFMNVFIKL